MATRTVNTVNSTYEIDEAGSMIRRVFGINQSTPRQGTDGEWKAYDSIAPYGGGLLIVWGTNPDGTYKCTWTSNVVSDTNSDTAESV